MKKDPHKNVDESVFAIMTWKADTGDQRARRPGSSCCEQQWKIWGALVFPEKGPYLLLWDMVHPTQMLWTP